MTEFTKEFIAEEKRLISVKCDLFERIRNYDEALDEIERLQARVQELEQDLSDQSQKRLENALASTDRIIALEGKIRELEQEGRWIPVRDYPSQVGWYRVITNNGTEQIREFVREPDRDIHYWDVKDGEWIMMYTNPLLPQPPQEEE